MFLHSFNTNWKRKIMDKKFSEMAHNLTQGQGQEKSMFKLKKLSNLPNNSSFTDYLSYISAVSQLICYFYLSPK